MSSQPSTPCSSVSCNLARLFPDKKNLIFLLKCIKGSLKRIVFCLCGLCCVPGDTWVTK